MRQAKLNPTLFDKLTMGDRIASILDQGRTELEDVNQRSAQDQSSNRDRYTEAALRASVRRELNWLLNTINLASSQDLSRAPQVVTSVLNYGCPDLTGRVATVKAVEARTREMEEMIRRFEPRLDPAKLRVEAKPGINSDNTIAYVIHGDVTAAVRAMPVEYVANVEVETGQAVVKE
jgi:type VI secretion system protein ImpF